jgi:hypothetical protein
MKSAAAILLAVLVLTACQSPDQSGLAGGFGFWSSDRPLEFEVTILRIPF